MYLQLTVRITGFITFFFLWKHNVGKKDFEMKILFCFPSRSHGLMSKHYKHNIRPWSLWLVPTHCIRALLFFIMFSWFIGLTLTALTRGSCLIDPWSMVHTGCNNKCFPFSYPPISSQLTSARWRIRWMKSSRWAENEAWAWNVSTALFTGAAYLCAGGLSCNPR